MSDKATKLRVMCRGTHELFLDLFERCASGNAQAVYSEDKPDVIEIQTPRTRPRDFGLERYKMYRSVTLMRLRYGFKPVLTAIPYENTPLSEFELDFGLSSFEPTTDDHLHYNWNFSTPVGRALLDPNGADALIWRAYRDKPKSKFCNYVFSDDWNPQTSSRRDFCGALSRYKRVDCAGKSLNNTAALFKLDAQFGSRWRAKLAFISDYKFTIAFENESADGYLSEKLLTALAVGSVPIYWGCPQAGEYINPRSFINAHDYDSFEALVAHVKRVDADPDLYQKYRDAPPLLPASRFYDMRRDLPAFLERVAAEALRRRDAPSEDGFLKWRRHYRVGKIIYAHRRLEWRYKQRRAADLRRLVKQTLRRFVKPRRRLKAL